MNKQLETVKDQVQHELEINKEARKDDFVLVAEIYRKYYGVGYTSFYDVMTHHKKWKLPGFDTIRRCRQKLQEENFELRADTATENRRIDRQKDFIEFALGEEEQK